MCGPTIYTHVRFGVLNRTYSKISSSDMERCDRRHTDYILIHRAVTREAFCPGHLHSVRHGWTYVIQKQKELEQHMSDTCQDWPDTWCILR